MTDWIPFALLGLAVWLWFDGMRARDLAVRLARELCARDGVQLLDDTVALQRMRLKRNEEGRLRIFRRYRFEYSDTGDNRRGGTIDLLGREPQLLYLEPRVWEDLHRLH